MAPLRVLARLSRRGGAGGLIAAAGRLQRRHRRRRRPDRARRGRRASSPTIPSATSCSTELAENDNVRGGDPADQLARRHDGRVGGALRELRAAGGGEAGGGGARRGRGLGRLCRGDRRRPHRRARQHADRLDRRDHGISRPHPGDGAARHRGRDGALLGAQGRAVAVPADQPGGAGASRRRWSPRATPGSAAWSASGAASPGRRSTRWRTARSSPAGWRWRTADRRDRRRARGARLARIARCRVSPDLAGPRLGGRARRAAGGPFLGRIAVKRRDSRGNIAPGPARSSIPSVPDSCQYGAQGCSAAMDHRGGRDTGSGCRR